MKKIWLFILWLFTLLFTLNFSFAKDYEYTNYDINANILIDGTINVQEDITANFFVQKHGIIRTIPLNYSVQGQKFHIKVSDIKVKGERVKKAKENAERNIRIGKSNKTIIGEHTYPISYTVYGLIRNFSGMGYSELYWNLIGYNFDTSINKVYAVINLPKLYTGFTSDDFLITTDGKTTNVGGFGGTIDWSQGDKIIITYDKGLSAYQGITLSVKFPNDYFKFDHKKQAKLIGNAKVGLSKIYWGILESDATDFINFLKSDSFLRYGVIIILILSIILPIRVGKIELKEYKEFAKKYKIIVQYTPPKGLNSAEVGLLLHRRPKEKDLFSLIYKWASEGLITIIADIRDNKNGKKIIKSIKVKKIKNIPKSAPDFEKEFFNYFKDEKEIVGHYEYYGSYLNKLDKHGVEMGWLQQSKTSVCYLKPRSIIIALLLLVINIIIPTILVLEFIVILLIAIIKGGPKEEERATEEGAKLISHILGYKEFLKTCDENKLRLFLKQDPLYFDKTLPYAVVFGLETQFLDKILPIMEEENIKPERFTGNTEDFGTLSHMIKGIGKIGLSRGGGGGGSSTSYSHSGGFSGGSAFGGGFSSGGGGGGGGGRSW